MKYFWATVKHKWFVLLAGLALHVPLWRLIKHDLSKFTPAELPHYNRQFYGPKDDPRGFAVAWLHHYHHNDHHPEHWVVESVHSHSMPDRDGCIVNNCLVMPTICIKEMVADMMGASKAYTGSWNMGEWLFMNLERFPYHPQTKRALLLILFNLGYRINWPDGERLHDLHYKGTVWVK